MENLKHYKMTDKQFQKVIDKLSRANRNMRIASIEFDKACIDRYGTTASDCDNDQVIDALLGGGGDSWLSVSEIDDSFDLHTQ